MSLWFQSLPILRNVLKQGQKRKVYFIPAHLFNSPSRCRVYHFTEQQLRTKLKNWQLKLLYLVGSSQLCLSYCFCHLEQIKCKKIKQYCCAQGQSASLLITRRMGYPIGFRQQQSLGLQSECGCQESSRMQRVFPAEVFLLGKGWRPWGSAKVEVTICISYSEINQLSALLPAFWSTIIHTPHPTSVLTEVSQYWNKWN